MQENVLSHKGDTSTTLGETKSDQLSVAYFTPGWPPQMFPNGIVTYVSTMVDGMRDLGHRSYVLTPYLDRSQDLGLGSQDVLQLSSRRSNEVVGRLFDTLHQRILPESAFRASFVRGLRRGIHTLAVRSRLDLLEMEESFGFVGALRDRLSIPVVVRLHGPWFLNGKVMGFPQDEVFVQRVRDEGKAIAEAFAITAPSRDVLEQTRHYYNLPLEKAVVIPCPIACTPKEQRWRSQDCDPNMIVFIGRFDRHKGGDLVIDAFAQVLQEFPNTRLIFAGPDRGCIDDQGRTWKFEEYVQDRLPGALELGQIEWLGQQPPSALRELRRKAQLTIVASRYDNFPYTALEALSLGSPIVGASAGGIPEIVADEVSGLLFRAGDAEALAIQINRLLRNPNLAAQLGRQAGEACAMHFAPEVVAKQSVDFYQRTLEHWSRSKESLLKSQACS
ncbi:MAG: glycosyltransferase family 4 protein [Lyngbya sp. HA4199-MV5]|jgi:glycosyltransferase involved in cell wall biosynthesis|nr:glycosyltransferase family 4 protein [Lyngbya sp. HA4199-MV5]